jgi:hypothetical protein
MMCSHSLTLSFEWRVTPDMARAGDWRVKGVAGWKSNRQKWMKFGWRIRHRTTTTTMDFDKERDRLIGEISNVSSMHVAPLTRRTLKSS